MALRPGPLATLVVTSSCGNRGTATSSPNVGGWLFATVRLRLRVTKGGLADEEP